MQRSLFPDNGLDIFLFVGSLFSAAVGAALLYIGSYWVAALNFVLSLFAFSLSYFARGAHVRKRPVDEYAEVIKKIGQMSSQLLALNEFLTREKQRVQAAETTVLKLQQEQATLEPLVSTSRETIEAILVAHARRGVQTVWKERFVGFALGTTASVLASVIYEYFKSAK